MSIKYGLNEEQWEAVTSPSPTIVRAAAGSGKTRCLIAKICHLIDSNATPESICAITFTNKAANEMKSRMKKIYKDLKGMQISTIHSMCVKIINKFIEYTPLKVPFTIYDDSEQLSIIKVILKSKNYTEDPYDILGFISKIKCEMAVGELEEKTRNTYELIEPIYKRYQEVLIKNNACDFDDLMIYSYNCLKQNPCKEYFSDLWKHLLVDEFQDTSTLQYEIIKKIYNPKGTLFAVGDEEQSIYGWRGAHPENIQDFITNYNPKVKYLTFNYRSCPEIVNQANNFIKLGKPMVAKSTNKGKVSVTEFQSHENEAEKIATALLQMKGYEETAILYRMNARSLQFEKFFTKYHIPYKVVGDLPFYKRKVVKDLMAMMKASNNVQDIESLARIINTPKRGFGAAKVEKLLLEGRKYAEEVSNELPLVNSFLNMLNNIKGKKPSDALTEILSITKYKENLSKESDLFMLSAFQDVVTEFDTVEELILASTFIEKEHGNGVRLMTAHAAKGLEFDRVFVVGVENEVWPHKNSIDASEETRLFFVAISRARKYLNVSYSKSKLYRGQQLRVEPSPLFMKVYTSLKT